MKNIHQLDTNMRINQKSDNEWQWLSPLNAPFQIAGFPWMGEEKIYRRLPQNPRWKLPSAVDNLANCTAGGQIRFVTDSPRLALRVQLAAPAGMYHMPATGQCGFDCYWGEFGEQRHVATTRYNITQSKYECTLFETNNASQKTLTLNFPLYQGVKDVRVGIALNATISAPANYESTGKVLFYGTSITQGGCAARPGMAFTNILSRRINREFINLGFSGNGKGEPELAHIIAEIPDVSCYVLDYDANVSSAEAMAQTLPEFIRILRESHPTTPILVLSRIPQAKEFLYPDNHALRIKKLAIQRDVVANFQAAGDTNISFLCGEELVNGNTEITVDGSHPTDLGFWLMANALEPVVKKLLK